MEHSHLAFAIARVIAKRGDPVPKYRCVGAIYQYYGLAIVPLAGTYRFMNLATQNDNGAIICDELRRYAELSERNPDRPCDYVTSLCEEAFDLDIEKRTARDDVSGHDVTKGIILGNSVTVLDISDLKNISVCFVYIPRGEHEAKDPRTGIPLTPMQYLEVFYSLRFIFDQNGPEQRAFAAKLKDVPMVPLATLAEVWPDDYKAPDGYEAPAGNLTQALPEHETRGFIPSLAELSLDWAITQAIKENQVDLLEHVQPIPGKLAVVLDRIKSLTELPSSAVQLLNKCFKASPTYPKEVDLSGYALSCPQVLKLLRGLGGADVERLNVSGNMAVDKAGLSSILHSTPKLRWLNVMNTAVTHEDVEGLLEAHPELFYHIDTFLHPFFYENSKRPYPTHSSCGFWYLFGDPRYKAMSRGIPSVPLLSTDGLIQCILDFGHFADQEVVDRETGRYYQQDAGSNLRYPGRMAILSSGIRPLERKPWESFPTRNIHFRARSLDSKQQTRSKYMFILWGWRCPISQIGLRPYMWDYGILVRRSELSNGPQDTDIYERCVDIPTFIELLQQEGRPPPSDLAKLQQVYDIFGRSNFRLASLDSL